MAAVSNEQNLQVLRVNHKEKMTEALESMFFEESLCDVTICCNGQSVKAHRVILAASSVYFKEIFATTQPGQYPIVFVKSISNEDLNAMLEFIYKGEVTVPQAQLESLVKSAETLGIIGLGKLNLKNQDYISNITGNPTPPSAAAVLPASSKQHSVQHDQSHSAVNGLSQDVPQNRANNNLNNGCSSSSSLQSSPSLPDDIAVPNSKKTADSSISSAASSSLVPDDLNGTSSQQSSGSSPILPPQPNQPKKRGRKRKHLLNGAAGAGGDPVIKTSRHKVFEESSSSQTASKSKVTKLGHSRSNSHKQRNLPAPGQPESQQSLVPAAEAASHSHSFGQQQSNNNNNSLPMANSLLTNNKNNTATITTTTSNQNGPNVESVTIPKLDPTTPGAEIADSTSAPTHLATDTCDISNNNHHQPMEATDSANDDSQPALASGADQDPVSNNGYNSSCSTSSGSGAAYDNDNPTGPNGKITKSKLRSWSQQISQKNFASVVHRPGSQMQIKVESNQNETGTSQGNSSLFTNTSLLDQSIGASSPGASGSPAVDPNNNHSINNSLDQRPIKIEGRPRGRPRKICVPKLNPMPLPLSTDSEEFKESDGVAVNASPNTNGTVTLSQEDASVKKESTPATSTPIQQCKSVHSNSVKLVRSKHMLKASLANKLSKSADLNKLRKDRRKTAGNTVVKRGRGRPPLYPKIAIDPSTHRVRQPSKPVVAPLSSLSVSSSNSSGGNASHFPTAATAAPSSSQTNGLTSLTLPPESAASPLSRLSSLPHLTTPTALTSASSLKSPALTPLSSVGFSECAVVSPVAAPVSTPSLPVSSGTQPSQ